MDILQAHIVIFMRDMRYNCVVRFSDGYIVYALMYFSAKCLLKVICLFIRIWNIVVMRKKRDCIFFLTPKSIKID